MQYISIYRISFIIFLSFLSPLKAADFIIDQNEAKKIVYILNQGKDYSTIDSADKVIFTKGVKLSWQGKGVFIVKSKSDIEFQENSLIESHGKGGLILHPNNVGGNDKPTVIFPEQEEPCIDFSKGLGAISLFYNPQGSDREHKYTNYKEPTHWKLIRPSPNGYFKVFMFINNKQDLEDIDNNLQGNYVLSRTIKLLYNTYLSLSSNFKGFFLYNQKNLIENHYSYSQYPRGTIDILLKNLPGKWNERILYSPLPLLEDERNIFKLAKKGSIVDFEQACIEAEKWQNKEKYFLRYPWVNSQGKTLLHVSLESCNDNITKFILENWEKNYSDHRWDLERWDKLLKKELLERQDFEGNTPLMTAAKYSDTNIVSYLYNFFL